MPDDLITPLLLVAVGAAAGVINSIAGGGSLLTLPMMIFVGLPPTVANATNRIALFIGGVGATHSFAKRRLIPTEWFRVALPPSVVGVGFGVWGATVVGDLAFERVLAAILLLAAGFIVWRPLPTTGCDALPPPSGTARRFWLAVAFFGLGVYSGFVQAGVGFLFTALLASQGLDLIRANGVKAALILAYAALGIVLFLVFTDLLDWVAGLTLSLGQFFGSKAGVRLQVLRGQEWIRTVFILAIVGFSLELILRR